MHIKISHRWDFENNQGQRLHTNLLPLLESIDELGRLTAAAEKAGLSYRHAWNLLNESETFFGAPLAQLEKGRGAKLTPLGETLLWSHQRIEARLHPETESFATELNAELQAMLANDIPVVRIYASHGYAVALMADFTRHAQVEMHYHAPEHALIALNEGRCRIAGFHQPIEMSIEKQSHRYRQLLDPDRFRILGFIKRQQGLIFKPDNPFEIRLMEDLNNPGLKFINRQPSSGTRILLEHLLAEKNIDTSTIEGYGDQEFTHSAIAAHIASGMADVGFGVEAAARRFDLGFAPVIQERYLWAYPAEAENDEDIRGFIATLKDPDFISMVDQLPGYSADCSGETVSSQWLFHSDRLRG